MTIGERFQAVRKAIQEQSGEKYTQKQMSETLGISRDSLANIENDRNPPTPPVIQLLCERHNVSEAWLRTGEGEMFLPLDRDKQIADFMKSLFADDDERVAEIKRGFISAISKLEPADWLKLAEVARDWIENTDA